MTCKQACDQSDAMLYPLIDVLRAVAVSLVVVYHVVGIGDWTVFSGSTLVAVPTSQIEKVSPYTVMVMALSRLKLPAL